MSCFRYFKSKLWIIFLLALPHQALIHGEILTFDQIKLEMSGVKKTETKKVKKEKTPKDNSNNKRLKKELEEANKKLDAYRYVNQLRSNKPFIMKELIVGDGDIIGGQTLLATRATATTSQLVVSNLVGTNLPKDAKIECTVITKYKRVCGPCTRLIIDGKATEIQAVLRNKDGSECAIGEISDDGQLYAAGTLLAEFSRGVLAVSQTALPTLGGNLVEASTKNKIKQGLINVGGEVSDQLSENLKTQEPVVFINKNERVTVYFVKGVEL